MKFKKKRQSTTIWQEAAPDQWEPLFVSKCRMGCLLKMTFNCVSKQWNQRTNMFLILSSLVWPLLFLHIITGMTQFKSIKFTDIIVFSANNWWGLFSFTQLFLHLWEKDNLTPQVWRGKTHKTDVHKSSVLQQSSLSQMDFIGKILYRA